MRKATILSTIILLVSLALGCRRSNAVPPVVRAAFETKFPATTRPGWRADTAGIWRAYFIQMGREVSANFDSIGAWLKTETELIGGTDLPQPLQAALRKKYPSYVFKKSNRIESLAMGTIYWVRIQNGPEQVELFLTPEGNFASNKKSAAEIN